MHFLTGGVKSKLNEAVVSLRLVLHFTSQVISREGLEIGWEDRLRNVCEWDVKLHLYLYYCISTSPRRHPARYYVFVCLFVNPLNSKGNYSATSNNTKLVHGPAQSPPRCTKCNSSPINGQCTNHCIAAI